MGWLRALEVDVVMHAPVAAALATEVGALLAPLLAAAFPGGACGYYALSPKVNAAGQGGCRRHLWLCFCCSLFFM